MLLTVPFLITALHVLGCMASLRQNNLLDMRNLRNCRTDGDYCSVFNFALVRCTDTNVRLCRYRCPLGQPSVRYSPIPGPLCASVCPFGYFVSTFRGKETCRLHSFFCPEGRSVILPGTSWHDTICGDPDDYNILNLLTSVKSTPLLDTLNKLTVQWVRDIPGYVVQELCGEMNIPANRTSCFFKFEEMLHGMPSPAELLYYRLNKLLFYDISKQLYDTVVKPFAATTAIRPDVSIHFLQPNPWWVGNTIHVIQTRVTIPLGMSQRYIPNALNWYTGKMVGKWIAGANKTNVMYSEQRYNIERGLDWTKAESVGFFVDVLDISLSLENINCGLFKSVFVTVELYDKHVAGVLRLNNSLDVNCFWKPKLHPACNCTHSLLHYINPSGLCSPTCIMTPFAHLSKGVEGSNNDWTLEITQEDPDTSFRNQGRVLYGSVPPKTERFCLVTTNIFTFLPGPARDTPSAPLDVIRCDVILIDFDVWIEDPPGSVNEQYFNIAVRSVLKTASAKHSKLYIPLAAENTLESITRQGWRGKIGMKIRFLHSRKAAPCQEELAAVLDWILTLQLQNNRSPRVVVIDVNVETVKSSDFDAINNLYGTKLHLIPGLLAHQISDSIRSLRYTVYNYFKCTSDEERCSSLVTVHRDDGKPLYQRNHTHQLPECHDVQPLSHICVVCRDGDVVIVCPNNFQPVDMKDSVGETLTYQHYRPQFNNPSQSQRLTPQQQQAETVLQELGLLVSSHGAFLNLDTISIFSHNGTCCEQVIPGRWSVGDYTLDNPYMIKLPHEEMHPERTELFVFEELCERSNNRAGIVVSIPSADYVVDADCSRVRFLNRNLKTSSEGSGVSRVHYSKRNLTGIIADMAKWGVAKYSLGYLDYTFGNSGGMTIFTWLSHTINSAAEKIRTLHYRYTRNSTFGDGTYSYANVNGVYKLEGSMFFQHVTDAVTPIKSFIPVPDIPDLRLGLSSDMNVGAPLPAGEFNFRDSIENVKFIPYGAHVVSLNRKNMTVFVDHEKGRICRHSPGSMVVRSNGLRLPSFGLYSGEDDSLQNDCCSHITGVEYRARIFVPLPNAVAFREPFLQTILNLSHWLGTPVLTTEEDLWLSSGGVMTSPRTLPFPQVTLGTSSTLDSMHLISKTVECITGSSSCMELGDYADNNWPQGGTGYPIAISSSVDKNNRIVVKMIIHVNHGAISVKIPCDTKPFSLGSEQPAFPLPTPGYYVQTLQPWISKVKNYMLNVEPLIARITQPLMLLYCPDVDHMLVGHLPSSEAHHQKSFDCVSGMDEYLSDARGVFFQFTSLIEGNRNTSELTAKRVETVATRTSALCLISTVLAVLINITLILMLCHTSKGIAFNQHRYRKLQ